MSFQETGQQFVAAYYQAFTGDRSQLGNFYTADSMLSYEGEQFLGVQAIGEKIGGLPNLTFNPESAVMDFQPSTNNAIFVLVSGALCIDGNAAQPLNFTQTFLLCPGGTQGYYVHNEIFRLNLSG